MFIIDFRNKNMSKYCFSVINNSNVDVVNFYSRFTQYATNTSIYLKVRSKDDTYVDKIAIASENVSVDEDALVVKWTMGAVSTHCKQVDLQLQFEKENGEIIAQTGIVTLTLADTIDVDELIPIVYPKVLEELQEQIDELKSDSVANIQSSYANDVLTIDLYNKAGEHLGTQIQVALPFSEKVDKTNVASKVYGTNANGEQSTINFSTQPNGATIVLRDNNGQVNVATTPTENNNATSKKYVDDEIDTRLPIAIDDWDVTPISEMYEMYGDKPFITPSTKSIIRITKSGNNYVVSSYDEYSSVTSSAVSGSIDIETALADYRYSYCEYENNQNKVTSISNQSTDTQYPSAKCVYDILSNIKNAHYQVVDTTTYPTLNDFLASTGEEGYVYLYPIDTTDLTKGYYRYVWENNAWLDLGTTQIDLTNYVTLNGNQTITGEKTFSEIGTVFLKILPNYGTGNINGNLIPTVDDSKTLGNSSFKWTTGYINELYFNGCHLYTSGYKSIMLDLGNFNVLEIYSYHQTSDPEIRLKYDTTTTNVRPTAHNTYDLGSSSYTWKDLYLSGTIYFGSGANVYKDSSGRVVITNNGTDKIIVGLSNVAFTTNLMPQTNNAYSLGTSSNKWKDLYLAGTMYGTIYSYTIDGSYKILYNHTWTNSNILELDYEDYCITSKSANTTFTLKTPPTGCAPEYKAKITNSGASAIDLTFTGVTSILTNNDEDVIINSNVITLSAGTTIECSILGGKMVAIVF